MGLLSFLFGEVPSDFGTFGVLGDEAEGFEGIEAGLDNVLSFLSSGSAWRSFSRRLYMAVMVTSG
jgi:hypothetical protein